MIRKLHFEKTEQHAIAKKTNELGDYKDCVCIRTIEVKTLNPSELEMAIEYRDAGGTRIKNIHLVDFRTKFVFQNGTYILDTRKIDVFNTTNLSHEVKISFSSIEKNTPISVDVFYFLCELEEMLAL